MNRRMICALGLLWMVLLMPPAHGEVDGTCEVTIQDVDVRNRSSSDIGDAITVQAGDVVTYEVVVTGPARHFVLVAEVGPYEVVLDERNFTALEQVTLIRGNTTFDGLPGDAAGTFRYRGEVEQWDGSACVGTLLLRIGPDSPWTPVIVGAIITAAAGSTSLIVLAVRGYQDTREVFDVVKDYVAEAKAVATPSDDSEE